MKPLRTIGLAIAVALLPSLASAQAPSEADLLKSIGTKKDGWNPILFKHLRGQMTPQQVAKYFPGADTVADSGIVEVPIEGKAGIARLKFKFQNDRRTMKPAHLGSATIIFEPALTDAPGFYETLWKLCERKYGKIKRREKIDKQFITWTSPTKKIEQLQFAQLARFPVKEGTAFHLAIEFEQGPAPGTGASPAGRKRR